MEEKGKQHADENRMDVDSDAFDEDEDVDGLPMDEDLDGELMEDVDGEEMVEDEEDVEIGKLVTDGPTAAENDIVDANPSRDFQAGVDNASTHALGIGLVRGGQVL